MFLKKMNTFSARSPKQKIHQRVARRRIYPLLFWRFEGGGAVAPLIAKKVLDL
jgi:hypothetical protein